MFRVFDKRSLKIEIQEKCSLRCEAKKSKRISVKPDRNDLICSTSNKSCALADSQGHARQPGQKHHKTTGAKRTVAVKEQIRRAQREEREKNKTTKKHDPRDCVFSLLNTSILKRFNAAAAPHRLILRG